MAEVDFNLTGDEPGSLRVAPTIRVEIYNQTYNIRTDSDSEYLIELAEFVDSRMREIFSGTPTADSLKVAILAALHIADELHRAKQAERRAESTEMIDNFLQSPRIGMLQARGLWKDRDDLPDFGRIRQEFDRL